VETKVIEALYRGSGRLADLYTHRGEGYASRRLIAALDEGRRVLEWEEPRILTAVDDVAADLERRGRIRRARAMNARAAAGLMRMLGPDDPVTLRAVARCASLLARADEDEKAIALGTLLLDACRQQLGDEDWLTFDVMAGTGAALARTGALTRARTLQRAAADGRGRVGGVGHPTRIEALEDLFMTTVALGDMAGADAIRDELREARTVYWKHISASYDLVLDIQRFMARNVEELEFYQRLDRVLATGAVMFERRPWVTR
jgi:hypothetical protein